MVWKQILFRIIGAVSFLGGVFAFYDFGSKLLPLFTQFVARVPLDSFEIFTTVSSFFVGALALTWIGVRLMALRSFSNTWLYYALLPITAWLVKMYAVGLIFTMDKILSQSVLYICLYILILKVVLFVHKYWFTPVSHESMRFVSLEQPEKSLFTKVRWIFVVTIVGSLLVLHPTDISTTLRMVLSPFSYLFSLLQ